MTMAVISAGLVMLLTAASLASFGHDVSPTDAEAKTFDTVDAGSLMEGQPGTDAAPVCGRTGRQALVQGA
jgi:hypothetical protein